LGYNLGEFFKNLSGHPGPAPAAVEKNAGFFLEILPNHDYQPSQKCGLES
jgi:hypothetical protein